MLLRLLLLLLVAAVAAAVVMVVVVMTDASRHYQRGEVTKSYDDTATQYGLVVACPSVELEHGSRRMRHAERTAF